MCGQENEDVIGGDRILPTCVSKALRRKTLWHFGYKWLANPDPGCKTLGFGWRQVMVKKI